MAHIYIIRNSINGKVYIGQTINSLKYRFSKHKGQVNCKNQCSALYSAFRKYGVNNFWIEDLENGEYSKEKLNELEIFYIKKYNSISPNGYNLQFGGNCFGMTEETKEKIRQSHKGREILWKDEISKTMKLKWENKEYRKAMTNAHSKPRGKYKKHSKPLRKDLPIKEIQELFDNGMNVNQIAKKYNVPYSTIKRRINNGD